MAGTLYVVGTPIGNLQDVTERARRVLGAVDVVACEDTRRTGLLLSRLGVPRPRLISLFEANEARRVPEVVELLRTGSDVALASDAGMPGVSDPGYQLVRACIEEGIGVDVVPGPSAVTAALVVSGLPTDRFAFEGFLPRSGRRRSERLHELAGEPRTIVVFESPVRVVRTLGDLEERLGDRRAAVVRELTKLHQEVLRGTLAELRAQLHSRGEIRGEIVLIVEGAGAVPRDAGDAIELARAMVRDGAKKREAARKAADATGVPAREIYDALAGG